MKVNKNSLFAHITAFAVIMIVLLIFFYPYFDGKLIDQIDTKGHTGMSKEVADYRQATGQQAFWTGTMFSGMPTTQISMLHPNNVLFFVNKLITLFLPYFMSYVFLYFIGFFFLQRILKINEWLSILGALAFTLSSYFLMILEVGHNSKAHAIGFMAPFIASMYLSYRGKYWLGGLLAAVTLGLEIMANHLQITYYLGIIAIIYAIGEFVIAVRAKEISRFFKASGILIVATGLAVAINFSNLYSTYEYSKESTRGKSELAPTKNSSQGLDRDYLTQWSYSPGETWCLMIPNIKGGVSLPISETHKSELKKVDPQMREMVGNWTTYWGEQPFTSGPTYIGAIVIFFFVLSLFWLKHPLKWPLLVGLVLCVLLAWGRFFMPLTDFFIDYVPMYSKFRAPAMMLVMAELIIPLLFILLLNDIINNREKYAAKLKFFYISFGLTAGISLLFYLMPSTFFEFTNGTDEQYFNQFRGQGYQIDDFVNTLISVRTSILQADAIRSFLFITAGAVITWLFIKNKLNKTVLIIGLTILISADMIPVAKRYLNESHFIAKRKKLYPYEKSPADEFILADNKGGQAKVLNLTVSVFNDASTSYYHRSIGGYHAAKLKKYQELIDYQLQGEIMRLVTYLKKDSITMTGIDSMLNKMNTIDMLNTKYIILNPNAAPLVNRHANGDAWFVDKAVMAKNADEEIVKIADIDIHHEAVVDQRFASQISKISSNRDSNDVIALTSYTPNVLKYKAKVSAEKLAVFSEIYSSDWTLKIDGKEAPVLRANYVLRAATIPAGEHELVFTIVPRAYNTGSKISLISSILLILLAGAYGFFEYRKKKKKITEEK